jgi:hypothetical protein
MMPVSDYLAAEESMMNKKRWALVLMVILPLCPAIAQANVHADGGSVFGSDGSGFSNDQGNGGIVKQKQGATPPTPVPEPSSLLLLGSGIAGFLAWKKVRRD